MKPRQRRNGLRWSTAAVVAALVGLGVWLAYNRLQVPQTVAAQDPVEPELMTAQVTKGDIILVSSGSGELVPAATLELGFRTAGTLSGFFVEVGDRVEAGDLLAELDTDDLERTLNKAEVELQIARLELAALQEGPTEAETADAEARIRDSQAELALAYSAYEQTSGSHADGVVETAKVEYDWWVGYYQQQKAAYEAGKLSQADHDWAMAAMIDAEGRWQDAFNDAQTEELQALTRINSAENDLFQAEQDLELLLSGPDSDELASEMINVDQALVDRERAAAELEEARLHAPFDGMVMEVGASSSVGEHVAADNSVVTLANLDHAELLLWVEEGDMASAAVGNRVSVVFGAYPDDTFSAEIERVEPVLVTVDGTDAVQAWASIDLEGLPDSVRSGMTAEVEVIGAEALDALLIPVEALREVAPGQYAVFVVGPDGELEYRSVAVGLTDYVNAQILAGLELGETVSLGEES